MRTSYASRYLVPTEIAWATPDSTILGRLDPRIGSNLAVGADMRLIQSHAGQRAQSTDFFQMEGNVYLAFDLGKTATLHVARGISATGEIYGLAYVLPITGGYVKAGRFVPSFGWKVDDHTTYVRQDLGFAPPSNSDVGVELGASPGHLDIQAAFTNGNRGATIANDGKYAASGNMTYRCRLGSIGGAVGVEGIYEPSNAGTFKAEGVRGYLTWRSVAWLAEADWFRREDADGGVLRGLVASHEGSVLLRRGLELVGTFDLFDPDDADESERRTRWGGGITIMPSPFIKLDAYYRHTSFRREIAVVQKDFDQTLVMAHFLY